MIEFIDAIRLPLVFILAVPAVFIISPWLLMLWPGWEAFR
jgi:hypothetical protein